MALNKNKDLKKYYSISEVANLLDVSESLLRYWEKEFPSISPRKTTYGVRQYTKEDIEEVRIIYNLLKVKGMKIAAAREALQRNKQGTMDNSEVLSRLQSIREELIGIRKELGEL